MIESQLLSKVLDENSFHSLNKYNIAETDFEAYSHVYSYIKGYVREYQQTPDYRTVVAKYEDFDYTASVSDSFAYLAKTLKGQSAKRKAVLRLAKVNENFKNMNGTDFAKWLKDEATALEAMANSSSSTMTNYATNGQERKEWYNENKENRSYTYIPTPYATLTEWLGGGFELGDYILLMAYTNKGKSWVGSDIGNTAHKNNFGVLHYSPELSKKQQVYRNDTLRGHFNNVDIRRGQLENETDYLEYLNGFNEENECPYYIKTMEDLPNGLSADVIEADLQQLNADGKIGLVIIDGFNLMKHPKIGRDGMSATSRQLRQIWGRHKVAGLVIHQTPTSSEKEMKTDEDELEVEIPCPQVTDYSETIAVVQDSATVLTFNQVQGRGRLLLAKCREPHVGKSIDLRCNFNLGYITEATPVDYF
ncbi:replicative DNA helicase [Neobacillus niacini]|uniref:DnaB-like helicase C-terminal domain-containing protein n=1 Tax=Neobacillus driksii TaxID=3035913 RepID=UPI002784008F|nr:DnaB-like helicase C-terminal domain-containing protein [Neobacillus niacini]MDQ0976595.1 replicative DNA helicase [Neobacillus niacini]